MTKLYKALMLGACVAGVSMMPAQGFAQKITPSHVYQIVDNAYLELEALHDADFSQSKDVVINLTPRKPRHVLQKAQEVYIKVQNLRGLNGLEVKPIVPIPVRAVTPTDVKASVDISLNDLKDLRSFYGVKAVDAAQLPSDKKPTDVYAHLARVSASLDAIGLPVVVPNDVYRVAETVVSDLQVIIKHKGLKSDVPFVPVKGKKPAAVYDETHILLEKIKTLTSKKGYEVKGGVVLLKRPEGNITPGHVMDSLGNAIAEIGAIKHTVGIKEAAQYAKSPSGKTPSDVFAVVKQAQGLVDILIAEEKKPVKKAQKPKPKKVIHNPVNTVITSIKSVAAPPPLHAPKLKAPKQIPAPSPVQAAIPVEPLNAIKDAP